MSEFDPDDIPHTYRRNDIYYGIIVRGRDPIRKSLGTRDPVVAKRKLREWLAEVAPELLTEEEERSFAQVAGSWIETYRREYTDKTWDRYKTSLKMLKPVYGQLLWSECTREALLKFVNQRRAGGATNATINRDLAVLSNIYEHAIDQGWATSNPTRTLSRRSRRERRDPFTIPTQAMVDCVFERMKSTYGDLCEFALETGFRLDEVGPLDWDRNVMLARGQVQLFDTKNHSVRVIDVSARALEILRQQPTRSGAVFLSRLGTPFKRISEMWREVMNRAERIWSREHPDEPFIRFRFHDLRHMFAINYLRRGGNLYNLQLEMGHSTIRQTEEYLQYLTPQEQLRAKGLTTTSEEPAAQFAAHSAAVLPFRKKA